MPIGGLLSLPGTCHHSFSSLHPLSFSQPSQSSFPPSSHCCWFSCPSLSKTRPRRFQFTKYILVFHWVEDGPWPLLDLFYLSPGAPQAFFIPEDWLLGRLLFVNECAFGILHTVLYLRVVWLPSCFLGHSYRQSFCHFFLCLASLVENNQTILVWV